MPLQREFKGLADYVGLYQAGNLPMELVGAVMPSMLVDDFVSPPTMTRFDGTLASQNVVVAAPAVPEGEMHRVRWLGVSWTEPAAGSCALVPVIFHLDEYFGLSPYRALTAAANITLKAGVTFSNPGLLLLPGMAVGWQAQLYSGAGNITVAGVYQHQVIGI